MSGKAALSASLAAMLFIAPAVARAQVQQGQQQAQQQNQAMQLVLHFEGNKTDLSDAAKATLDQRIPMLRANPELRVVIMPDVCANTNMIGMNTGDDLKAGGDTMPGRAGDTTAMTPPDSTVEEQRQPGDTGGAIMGDDTGEAKADGETGAADENVEKNRELIRKRAEAARDYLVKHGVEERRIEVTVSKTGKGQDTKKQTDDRNPAGQGQGQGQPGQWPQDQGQQGQGQQGQGQQPQGQEGHWPQSQGQQAQGQSQQSQFDCPQQAELKAGEQRFRLLIATDGHGQNFNKQNRNQDTKQNPDTKQNQDTTQKQGGEQQPY
jgi:hypothetical protein